MSGGTFYPEGLDTDINITVLYVILIEQVGAEEEKLGGCASTRTAYVS